MTAIRSFHCQTRSGVLLIVWNRQRSAAERRACTERLYLAAIIRLRQRRGA